MAAKKEIKNKFNSKYLKRIGLVFIVVIIATLIDWITHSSNPSFYVPFEYYHNKVVFAFLWGFVALWLARNVKSMTKKAFIFSAVIALVLQTKYFFQGYDLYFVFLFMFLHFGMFLVPALILFNKYKKIFT